MECPPAPAPASSLTHLLRRHVEGDSPEVDLLVGVNAGHDEEEAGALGPARPQPAESEHHGSLVLLDHLKEWNVCIPSNSGLKFLDSLYFYAVVWQLFRKRKATLLSF